ncbi:MFS transporter [uncultured Rhodoferax sp.]|uniref:MFS transporter n=1 Tax=uncultured Rhodoferax sp. TaxID=223188 RepID=UPI0025F29C39|nr:MFS transporter [uncultured Rhodoferax sp.]
MQSSSTPPPVPLTRSARWALTSLSLSLLLSSLGTSIANVGLPTLAQAFGAIFAQVQWVVLAYLLAITTLIVSVGRLGDLLGRRRLLLGGIALFTFASALCGLAPTLPWLIAARALQGLGAAVMMALTMALVGELVPKARTGSAMGLLGTMSAVGTALGPSLGGVLIATLGWRALFLVNLPLGALALLFAVRCLPSGQASAAPSSARFDYAGTLLLAFTLAAYALAMTLGHGHWGLRNLGLLAAAALGVGLFVHVEARAPAPLVRLQMFRDAGLGAGLVMNALVATVMMATFVVGPFYLARGLGLEMAAVGAVMAVGPVVSALTGVLAGRLVDRFAAPRMVAVGLAAMVGGAVALAVLPLLWGVAGYVTAMLVLTPGYQLFQAANNTAALADIPAAQRGVTSGMLNLARNLGLVTGASLMGAVFAWAVGTAEVASAAPAALAAGLQWTFALAAVLLGGALALAWRGDTRAKPTLAA